MLFETQPKLFKHLLGNDPHPFVSEVFIRHNEGKVEKIIHLVENEKKTVFGLAAGVRDKTVLSPFSAPFGGFHFQHDLHYTREIDDFLDNLMEYLAANNLNFRMTLPPDIYHAAMNAKICNAMIRKGFKQELPEITNWINLSEFGEEYGYRDSRTYYRQAVKNELAFNLVTDKEEKKAVYNLVKENRARMGRPIFMTSDDLLAMETIWPVDYFSVTHPDGEMVASAIFYPYIKDITFAVFWGDSENGRPLRAMDFLLLNLWNHYKDRKFKYIDLGISTEAGIPNSGLLRFKETHDCTSSLRFSFSFKNR